MLARMPMLCETPHGLWDDDAMRTIRAEIEVED